MTLATSRVRLRECWRRECVGESGGCEECLPILAQMHLDEPEPVLLSTKQTANMLGISRRSVAALCRKGEIRAIRLGECGRWRILRHSGRL